VAVVMCGVVVVVMCGGGGDLWCRFMWSVSGG